MLDLSRNCADIYPLHGVYVFKSVNNNDEIVICDHDFDDAIMVHQLSASGWSGFLLHFHCHEPWKDKEWEIANISELIELLELGMKLVSSECFNETHCFQLINFLKVALKNNAKVTISHSWGGV